MDGITTRAARVGGHLLAGLFLTTLASPAGAGEVVEYVHLDAIGNVRAVTNQAQVVVERHDYLPFGEECTTGPCASNPGLNAGQPRKFTGKERDPETGFDYFGARYYGSKIGRFTTVDPVLDQSEALLNPQLWNRYAYGRNNPLRYVDPDGRAPLPTVMMVTTVGPPALLPNRVDAWIGIAEGVLMTVVPGLEIQANNRDQAFGQVLGQAATVAGGVSALAKHGRGPQVTRYMTEGEVNEALRTGNIPNYGRDGLPRPTHVTTDPPVTSAAEAAAKYEITPPTHRATVPARRVQGLGPAPDGRPTTSGGGGQAATSAPIPVKPSEIKPLDR
jgi:RHS repeat-associated protein